MLTRTFKRRVLKTTALFFVVNILLEAICPAMAWALTSGPSQPEYSSFEPVSTTNMVNEFSGDFNYNLPVVNIPGPNGGGYAMSLAYHSGASSEEEASWVGFGWTLNPGAINRGKQGVPDDFSGDVTNDNITYYNQTKKNTTVSASPQVDFEIYSLDLPTIIPTIRYNNYRGFGTQLAVSANVLGGMVNLDYTVSGESPHCFSASLNTAALLQKASAAAGKGQKKSGEKAGKKNKRGLAAQYKREHSEKRKKAKEKLGKIANSVLKKLSSAYGLGMFGKDERVSSATQYSGFSVNTVFTFGAAPSPLHLDFEFGGSGSYTEQTSQDITRASVGALYSNGGGNDYTVEKQATYNKRDRYLSIPHQTPDAFQVSGEGLSGSFKLINPNLGNFTGNSVSSQTIITNTALDITAGENFGFGFNLGLGVQTLSEQSFTPSAPWGAGDPNAKPFFRFNNDLGGNVIFSQYPENSNPNSPSIGSIQSVFLDPANLKHLSDRPGASSAVGYSTVGDRKNHTTAYSQFRSPTCDSAIRAHVCYNDKIRDRIAELYTVNESGNTYVYGLPVFSADEREISFNANFSGDGPIMENNHLMWRNAEYNFITKVGEEQGGVYCANTHLLTQITTPDYIDRKMDGPSSDDFGGWTKFNYRPADFMTALAPPLVVTATDYQDKTKGKDNWYKYRMPYNGMYYSRGELSDARDDMGSMQSGKKEIYYLKTVETKTHVAYFVTNKTNVTIHSQDAGDIVLTGSLSNRSDGCSAADDATAANSSSAMDVSRLLEKLERIVVYAKPYDPTAGDVSGKPISTVHFDYYAEGAPEALVKNLPNSAYTDGTTRGGKLTLRRVWFENEGIVNAKIAPYEFKYEYKDLATDIINPDFVAKYPSVLSFATQLSTTANKPLQNPNYSSTQTDGWGGYLFNGAQRAIDMRPWLDQSKILQFGDVGYNAAVNLYDPAAWQLKQIKLPSGGLILVQYEQHDYQYVQDQPTLAMVSLTDNNNTPNGNKFYVNTPDIGLDLTDPALSAYIQKVNTYLANEKIFYKFLYTLIGGDTPTLTNCRADYVDGYVSAHVGVDGTGFYIQIEAPTSYDPNNFALPFDACRSFVTRRKAGLIINSQCDNPETEMTSDPLAATKALLERGMVDLNAITNSSCPTISSDYSYFRLPTFHAKRAGGVRVKRLLMYDQGMEANSDVLYGTEYFYQNEDGTSSGVATNEPHTMREENALIRSLLKRSTPSWAERVLSGTDRENFEGPLGESLLPAASIGYARVVTQNIHTGKTGTGFKVSEFYTAKDYPVIAKASDVDQFKPFPIVIPAVVVNIQIDQRSAAQAYQITMNNMHGKQKRVALFGGQYGVVVKPESAYVKTYEEVSEYFAPGEKVQVMDENGVILTRDGSGAVTDTTQFLGREESVTYEAKIISDEVINGSIQVDPSIGIFGIYILPQLSLCPYFDYELRTLRTTVINKVVSYTALPKRVTTTQDGIVHVSENKMFNKYTGNPVVTATYDGYDKLVNLPSDPTGTGTVTHDGSYTHYDIPAHWTYANMGQKNKNQGVIIDGCSLSGLVLTVPTPPSGSSFKFVRGDLIRLSHGVTGSVIETAASATYGMYYVESVAGSLVTLQAVLGLSPTLPNYSGPSSSIRAEVLISGYTNQLNQVSGKIAVYGNKAIQNPLTSGNINSLTNVYSASVDTYSDGWDNSVLDTPYGLNITTPGDKFETGKMGKWRVKSNYAYKTDVKDAYVAGTPNNKVYNKAGIYTTAFSGFNYTTPPDQTSTTWINGNTVNIYSPDGNVLEEQNSLGVKSTALFSHKENVASLIAKNASYGSSFFVSYEDQSADSYVSNAQAHSGQQSLQLTKTTPTKQIVSQITIDNLVQKQGLQFRFWTKSDASITDNLNQYITLDLGYNSAIVRPRLTKIAKVGEWVLYEGILKDLPVTGPMSATLTYSGGLPVWFDDIRIQPYEAQMTCYVYDRTNFRLLASFDDQHFGLYYQYNAEGKLVRKLVETERGMKTISETQYNTPVTAQ
ncbi:MAG: hypothetical protein JWO58_3117 [Chitinophagaceae bacterium]|nr:hypothetical protein [Chitinophagaceae bacterium]